MAQILKVPPSLYEKYHGTGYGLVAVLNGEIVDLKYFEDISDEFYIDADAEIVLNRLKEIITDQRVGEWVRYFQSLGEIHTGIFSCYEFVEL